jgi:hypothetical protein
MSQSATLPLAAGPACLAALRLHQPVPPPYGRLVLGPPPPVRSGLAGRGSKPSSPTLIDRAALAAAQEAERLRDAWSAWLRSARWAHFLTFTAERAAPPYALRAEFIAWERRMNCVAQRALSWFYVVELGPVGGRAHMHVLVAGTAAVPCDRLGTAWQLGDTHVRVYDPARDAARYVTKDLANAPLFDVSRRWPPSW